ncbi:MAG: DNA repair protein RecN [Tenacibaculum sp.]
MLTHLSIYNYALIDELSIDFTNGLSIITGETGAGKSILLGALGLITGKRADLSSLKNAKKKCMVEAQFALEGYNLQTYFNNCDLDYHPQTIIRREIQPSGKSRAFVNDTPVTLSVLADLKSKLIDIHSQHQSLQLSDINFKYALIDTLAKNRAKVASYKIGLKQYHSLKKELKDLQEETQKHNEQYEYNLFLFNELKDANLQLDEQKLLEQKLDRLNNVEDIKQNITQGLQIMSNEEIGIQSLLQTLENRLHNISAFSTKYKELYTRTSSVRIELDDVFLELESENEKVEFNPHEAEELNQRLQLIYNLQKKHAVNSVEDLVQIYEQLSEKTAKVEGASESIKQKQNQIREVEDKLTQLALKITAERQKAVPKLKKELERLLSQLGIPNAQFQIELASAENFNANGKDQLSFLFSANKGGRFGELRKIASGGELSRIMLSVKNVLSKNTQLPTVIFDEIDTGVSGEVSNKIAAILKDMSSNMQVIAITHLPQIASKGQHHYKVYKGDERGITSTNLKLLSYTERVAEIAEMLSGKAYSDSAVNHAKELLN